MTKKAKPNPSEDGHERIDGLHVDYLSFVDWRDRIKAGLCRCTEEEHRDLDPENKFGVNVDCSRVALAAEILKDMSPRWPWGIATELCQVLIRLERVALDLDDDRVLDEEAAAILDELAKSEAADAEINRDFYRRLDAEGRNEGDEEAA